MKKIKKAVRSIKYISAFVFFAALLIMRMMQINEPSSGFGASAWLRVIMIILFYMVAYGFYPAVFIGTILALIRVYKYFKRQESLYSKHYIIYLIVLFCILCLVYKFAILQLMISLVFVWSFPLFMLQGY